VPPEPLIEVRDLHVQFPVKGYGVVRAVDGVSLSLAPAEIVGLVGESGCGKTTIGRCITGELAATRGEVLLDGTIVGRRRRPAARRSIQMVYQDPATSLNPRLSVRQVLAELLLVHRLAPRTEVEGRCRELLAYVGLPPKALDGYPHQFSGGQRQRIAIARALAVEPHMLVADEPVSALDVSVQATILALFAELRERLGLAILLISHNLAVVRHLSDRVVVMYLGRVAEAAPRDALFGDPRAPYTQVLLKSAPRLTQVGRTPEAALKGDPPSAIDIPPGCRFHTRCPRAETVCATDEPQLLPVDGRAQETPMPTDQTRAHLAACHFRDERPWVGVGTD
jgi:oligopeptide/dipeptide ABC transporter ATP-binding protein